MTNPTIQRRRLGIALKRAREAAGLTQDEAGELIDAGGSKISRLELGQSGIRLPELSILLSRYGVPDEEVAVLRELARAGRQRGRWSSYRDNLPSWFRQYIALEGDAAQVRWYQVEIIPGILQTEEYVRPILGNLRVSDAEMEQQVKIRMERQYALDRGPEFMFILSESAIRRAVGGPAVMAGQLEHLAALSERPNVTLQVLPFDAQTYTVASFTFINLSFGDGASDTIYTEDYTDADYLDAPGPVSAYARLWDDLRAAALGPVESVNLIVQAARDFREK